MKRHFASDDSDNSKFEGRSKRFSKLQWSNILSNLESSQVYDDILPVFCERNFNIPTSHTIEFRHPFDDQVMIELTEHTLSSPENAGSVVVRGFVLKRQTYSGGFRSLMKSVSITIPWADLTREIWDEGGLNTAEEQYLHAGIAIFRNSSLASGVICKNICLSKQLSRDPDDIDFFRSEVNLSDWVRGSSICADSAGSRCLQMTGPNDSRRTPILSGLLKKRPSTENAVTRSSSPLPPPSQPNQAHRLDQQRLAPPSPSTSLSAPVVSESSTLSHNTPNISAGASAAPPARVAGRSGGGASTTPPLPQAASPSPVQGAIPVVVISGTPCDYWRAAVQDLAEQRMTRSDLYRRILEVFAQSCFSVDCCSTTFPFLAKALPVMDTRIATCKPHERRGGLKIALEVASQVGFVDAKKLKREEEDRAIFEAALIVLLYCHPEVLRQGGVYMYPTLDAFKQAYPEFVDCDSMEIQKLFDYANFMKVVVVLLQARGHGGHLMERVTQICEGRDVKYIQGGGQRAGTTRRKKVLEREGGLKGSSNLKNVVHMFTEGNLSLSSLLAPTQTTGHFPSHEAGAGTGAGAGAGGAVSYDAVHGPRYSNASHVGMDPSVPLSPLSSSLHRDQQRANLEAAATRLGFTGHAQSKVCNYQDPAHMLLQVDSLEIAHDEGVTIKIVEMVKRDTGHQFQTMSIVTKTSVDDGGDATEGDDEMRDLGIAAFSGVHSAALSGDVIVSRQSTMTHEQKEDRLCISRHGGPGNRGLNLSGLGDSAATGFGGWGGASKVGGATGPVLGGIEDDDWAHLTAGAGGGGGRGGMSQQGQQGQQGQGAVLADDEGIAAYLGLPSDSLSWCALSDCLLSGAGWGNSLVVTGSSSAGGLRDDDNAGIAGGAGARGAVPPGFGRGGEAGVALEEEDWNHITSKSMVTAGTA